MFESNKTIVENIKSLSKAHNTNIKQLEKELGFGNGMIGKWANAPKSPPIDKIGKIAAFFGVSVEYVMSDHPAEQGIKKAPVPEGTEVEKLTDAQKAAWELICRWDDEKLRKFIAAAKAMLEE